MAGARHKFEVGNTWGRPPLWGTAEEFAAKAIDYFQSLEAVYEERSKEVINDIGIKEVVKWKECIKQEERPTITGLALYMGYDSRANFYKQGNRSDEFRYIVDRCRLVVEHFYEIALFSKNTHGAIFALINMGWYNRATAPEEVAQLAKNDENDLRTLLDAMPKDRLESLISALLKV